VSKAFDDRETAAVGLCLRLIEAMRSRHRAGILDAAAQAESWLQRNYGDLQRSAAPAALVRMR
jgi:hypothetical protein